MNNWLILLVFVLLFLIAFFTALKSLKDLEVPEEILNNMKKGKKTPKIWGVIIFLKGKTVHYSSSSLSGSDESAAESESFSINSSSKSDRIDV